MKKILILISIVLSFFDASVFASNLIEKKVELVFSADEPNAQMPWIGFSFQSGVQVVSPNQGYSDWDLRFKQGYVGSNKASVCVLTNTKFEDVKNASQCISFTPDERYDPSGPAPEDFYNRVLMGWYEYFFFEGHLMAPNPNIYVVKNLSGQYAKVEMLDYIKNGNAIRVVVVKDLLGRVRKKKRSVKIFEDDGKVHVILRYVLNTSSADQNLDPLNK